MGGVLVDHAHQVVLVPQSTGSQLWESSQRPSPQLFRHVADVFGELSHLVQSLEGRFGSHPLEFQLMLERRVSTVKVQKPNYG